MVVSPTYPGVYIQELPSGVHTIQGVATSNTAFVDYFSMGPVGVPVLVNSFAEFQQIFGGLSEHSEASYAILQYFLNGGNVAYVLRLVDTNAVAAYVTLPNAEEVEDGKSVTVTAASPGMWGSSLQVAVWYPSGIDGSPKTFNLYVRNFKQKTLLGSETYLNMTMQPGQPNSMPAVVNNGSSLIQINPDATDWPAQTTDSPPTMTQTDGFTPLDHGSTGSVPIHDVANWTTMLAAQFAPGMPLATVPFDILCLPITALLPQPNAGTVLVAAQNFCEAQRAFLIVDPPPPPQGASTLDARGDLLDWISKCQISGTDNQKYAAIYYPQLTLADPLQQYRPRVVGPSGTVAGIYARTDSNRGVWKAPAGTDASLVGAQVTAVLTDTDSGALNPLGINVVRNFPIYGNVVWGARTLAGADQLQSDYKYVPVRPLTSYSESSLYLGTQWAVFEPNDETLWSSLRTSVNTFMAGLAQQGAFYNYVVRCDSTTTTAVDIANGVCNILVAFAPVKPAEFIIIQIQQLAGQAAS